MPRVARTVIAGWCYHVISRGNNRTRVFHEPPDYAGFLALVSEAQARVPLDLLAACVMPNHFHFVLRPDSAPKLAIWVHWLLTSHAARHHRKNKSSGRIWEGRFKAFAIQHDRHLITVMRYVERNALRARIVERAEDWPWGSLAWRKGVSCGPVLAGSPVPLPARWGDYVNAPQSLAELSVLRECANRQRPYGDDSWVGTAATELHVSSSLRRPGRPPGKRKNQ